MAYSKWNVEHFEHFKLVKNANNKSHFELAVFTTHTLIVCAGLLVKSIIAPLFLSKSVMPRCQPTMLLEVG